ncbi:hypothetical protein F0562_027576 [Nyssa sinensis]|uniref:Uncharacterized protein n=1 Tax=Nyssa sinensis TaxID=561372 RepID=A0A5J5B3E9_9ASTE|nr:hypothetical protein F0562_027576 [Nyssa sinensis]
MGNSRLTMQLWEHIKRGRWQTLAQRMTHTVHESSNSNWRASLEEKFRAKPPREAGTVSIYKIPTSLRQVEPKAYSPSIISIGPYHHGKQHLKATEELKWQFFRQLSRQNCGKVDILYHELKELEQEARSCYSESLQFDSDKFVEIMLVDGCFIIELFRELMKNDFRLFDLTSSTTTPNPTFKELALRFFDPLMSRDSKTLKQSIAVTPGNSINHFLDLFRSSILPRIVARGKEPHLFRSVTELREAGVKIQMEKDCRPLKLSFKKGVMKIPPLYIDDYKGTLFRNMVAFEQCHLTCKPDITTYLFFLDGLISSAKDIELLHYAGVIQHSLGSNKEVARLVNTLCKEVARDVQESYLHKMVWKINCYCNDGLTTKKARLKHDYFNNPWATISTLAAILLLFLTLLQTSCSYGHAEEYLKKTGFWISLKDFFSIPFPKLPRSTQTPIIAEDGFEDYQYAMGI